jgi:hypothetical protein
MPSRSKYLATRWLIVCTNIDVSVCPKCGGEARVIASIEDQQIIDKILAHLMKKGALPPPPELLPATRASPDSVWFA